MERIVTLRFVSKEDGLSAMGLGTAKKWGFVADYRPALDNKFTALIFDGEKIEGIEVLKYKTLIAGVKEVTFKIQEGFNFKDSFLEEFIDIALRKIANKNFKSEVKIEKRRMALAGCSVKYNVYAIYYTTLHTFIQNIKDYFSELSPKKLQEIEEKAIEIYKEKVKNLKYTEAQLQFNRQNEAKARGELRQKLIKKYPEIAEEARREREAAAATV